MMLYKKIVRNFTIQCIFLFFIFICLASVLVDMPIREIGTKMVDNTDAYLTSWLWSWEAHILATDPLNFFNTNIFAPFNNTLAFSETMLGTAIFAWPILLLSHNNAALTYNLVMLLTYAIAGLGMYLLAYQLTKNKLAALISAMVYAFAPYKLFHYAHLHLSGMWLPYIFLLLHCFFNKQSWKNTLGLAIFALLSFLTSFHYFIFLPVVIFIFWLNFYLSRQFKFSQKNLIKIIVALLVLTAVIAPLISPFYQVKKENNFFRSPAQIEIFSPDLVDFIMPSFLYDSFYVNYINVEKVVAPGITVYLLLIISLYFLLRKRNYYFLEDNKKNIIIYSSIGLISFLLSFGFYVQLSHNSQSGVPGLYQLFYHFMPGFDGIRATGRFSIFLLISICVFIGFGVHLWQEKFKEVYKKMIFLFVIITCLFFELSFVPVIINYSIIKYDRTEKELLKWLSSQSTDKIFLELPMGIRSSPAEKYDVYYLFSSRQHFRKLVNGYSSYYPFHYWELVNCTDNQPIGNCVINMAQFRVNYLILHFDRYPDPAANKKITLNQMSNLSNFKYITNFGNNYVFEIIY